VVRVSCHAVWATLVIAMAAAGCGSSPSRSSDGGQDGDAMGSNLPRRDAGLDGPAIGSDASVLCFGPNDCSAGQACCLILDSSAGGTVSCRDSALCVADGVTTFVACETIADCPPSMSECLVLASANNRDFKICFQ
jgi:hypothetical protein